MPFSKYRYFCASVIAVTVFQCTDIWTGGYPFTLGRALAKGLTVGYGEFPPNQFTKESKAKGICVEIIQEISGKANIPVKFEEFPWKRLLKLAETGRLDMVCATFLSQERKQFLYYPEDYLLNMRSIIIGSADSKARINSLEDLRGKEVAVGTKYNYNPDFTKADYFKKIEIGKTAQLEKIVRSKRMAFAAVHETIFFWEMKRLGFEKAFKILYVMDAKPLYFAFSRKSKQVTKLLVDRFDKLLTEFKQSPRYRQILAKYGLGDR